jgi:hypothetical protein
MVCLGSKATKMFGSAAKASSNVSTASWRSLSTAIKPNQRGRPASFLGAPVLFNTNIDQYDF